MTNSPNPTPHRGKVLFIDDDQLFQQLAADELSAVFDVITCGSVEDALAALERALDLVAVVADLRLGTGASGAQLLAYVRRLLPRCRRILVSGSASADEVEEALTKAAAHLFLPKPWNPGQLMASIQQ